MPSDDESDIQIIKVNSNEDGLEYDDEFEIDFTGLSDYGTGTITDITEFLASTDAAKTIKALTYSKLKADLTTAFFQSYLAIFGDLNLTAVGNSFASNTRRINWNAYNGAVETASISYAGSSETLNISSRGGSGNIQLLTGSSEAIRLQTTNSSLISTNNISS